MTQWLISLVGTWGYPAIFLTMAGAIPWNFALAYAGYKLGQHYETVAATLTPFVIPIAIGVVLLLAAAWWFGRKLGEEEEKVMTPKPTEI
jgi:membrane protein DedA with SNARE-associated domain